MKTIKILSIAFAVCLTLWSCGGGDDDDTPTPQPQPTPGTVKGKHFTQTCNMPADASETIVTLTGLTSEVTRKKGSASWLTVNAVPYTGGTPQVAVVCTQNLGTDARQQEVSFIAANDTLVLTVRQAAYTGGTDVDNPNDTFTDQPAFARGEDKSALP